MLPQKVDILGCEVDALRLDEATRRVIGLVERRGVAHATVVNAAKLVRMRDDDMLRKLVRDADLVTADGAAVVYAARWLGEKLPGRTTGCDLMQRLLEIAPNRGWRVYFLGATPTVLSDVVRACGERYPGITFAGFRDGYFDIDNAESIATAIRDAQPDLLFIGMGTPRQERFLSEWRDTMQVPFSMGVGGSFDVVSGLKDRAPRWMRDNGLEWAHRLAIDPRHMWRRAIVDSARFAVHVNRAKYRGYRLPEP
jgi:N-acetylglucosaminyldiphosphoundecaprenol N-acetyl-beta-D-mannosaminyltransferase